MKRNNKKGFTIVELVIVIAVIAILSAVLIPTFGGVVDKANASADLQNARNAYTEYLVENPTTDIDYVKQNNKFYQISEEFEVVDAPADGTLYIDAATDKVAHTGACVDTTPHNLKCDMCGADVPCSDTSEGHTH